MFCIVHDMRVLVVSMDSVVSFAVGDGLASIWNATVSRDPPSMLLSSGLELITKGLVSSPSGRIEKPEDSMAMLLESTPVITDCIPGMSTAARTTIDSNAFVQLSWRIHKLVSFDFVA